MIPLRDVIPSRTAPVVTVGLIAVNALAFVYELALPPPLRQEMVLEYGVVPGQFSAVDVVSGMFLHGGWLQVLGNMWYLWIFGENVEDRLGHIRFLVFYLLCGAAAAAAQAGMNLDSYIPVVGASGAIAGVMGAYFILYPQSRVLTLIPLLVFTEIIEVRAVYFLGVWFLLQLSSGIGSIAHTSATFGGADVWSLAAGLVTGAGTVFVFQRPERRRLEWYESSWESRN